MVPIWRTYDAKAVNAIMNHPDVRPWISEDDGEIDVTWKLDRPDVVIALLGEFGAFTAYRLLPGVYEFHTQVLPQGRGKWALDFARAGQMWMFSHTDADELLTRIPESHRAAIFLAHTVGFRQHFTDDHQFLYRGKMVKSLVHSISIEEWASQCPGLEQTGRWLHTRIDEVGRKSGVAGSIWPELHEDCPAHNRYLGAAYCCALGGQLHKGVRLYNRWLLASHVDAGLQAKVISCEPPQVWLYYAVITLLPSGDIDISPETGKCLKLLPVHPIS